MLLTHTSDMIKCICGYKPSVVEKVSNLYRHADVPYGPVDYGLFHKCVPFLPANSRIIVVDAKEKDTSLLYTSEVITLCRFYYCIGREGVKQFKSAQVPDR